MRKRPIRLASKLDFSSLKNLTSLSDEFVVIKILIFCDCYVSFKLFNMDEVSIRI